MTMKQISSFEWGRIIALFAVIAIHAKPFMTMPIIDDLPWVGLLINQLGRFAVPLFFLLAGFLVQPRLIAAPFQTLKHYSFPLLKVWAAWSIIYLLAPFNLQTVAEKGYLAERTGYWNYLMQNPLNTLFEGGLVHLWYIPALLSAIVILATLVSIKQEKYILPIALALYVFGLIAGSYEPIFGVESPLFTRNGPFFSTLIVALGFEIRRHKLTISQPIALSLLLGGMLLHLAEAYFFMSKGVDFNIHDFLVGTPIWVLGIFFLLQANPTFGDCPRVSRWSKDVLGVYLCHLLVIIYIMNIASALNIDDLIRDLTIIPLTFIISMVLIWLIELTPLKRVLLR